MWVPRRWLSCWVLRLLVVAAASAMDERSGLRLRVMAARRRVAGQWVRYGGRRRGVARQQEQARGGVCVASTGVVGWQGGLGLWRNDTAKNGHGLAIRRCCGTTTASCLGDGLAVRCYDCEWWRRDGMGWPVVGLPASGLALARRQRQERAAGPCHGANERERDGPSAHRRDVTEAQRHSCTARRRRCMARRGAALVGRWATAQAGGWLLLVVGLGNGCGHSNVGTAGRRVGGGKNGRTASGA